MWSWLCQLWTDWKARRALLEQLEQQAYAAKEQLNASLLLAHTAPSPEAQVQGLRQAQTQFAQLQAIAAQHPKMRLTNEQEVDIAIQMLQEEFGRSGYFALADARSKQSASAHVNLSQRARDLLQ